MNAVLERPVNKIIHLPAIRLLKDFLPEEIKNGKTALFAFSDPNTIRSKYRTRLIELPGTYKETTALKSKYPDTDIYAGTTATKANFLQAYLDTSVQYIHLALHGIANSAEKDDVKLYFRTSEGGLDSLYGYELLRYKSRCKKIVLSACQSGLGSYVKGEGLFSLPRYFMINGATDVVFNYWDVED
ncbi:MAG: CHAT domain-containing protein [Saprospiraceae bacterium]|nr:CHAT domain-containing protein [Saprospiraceae bacterium]